MSQPPAASHRRQLSHRLEYAGKWLCGSPFDCSCRYKLESGALKRLSQANGKIVVYLCSHSIDSLRSRLCRISVLQSRDRREWIFCDGLPPRHVCGIEGLLGLLSLDRASREPAKPLIP